MLTIAPRIPPSLLDAIERFSSRQVPIAEINRLVGAQAERLGVTRPSYQRVRELVHEARRIHARRPSRASVALDVATQVRPVSALLDELAEPPRSRLRDRVAK